MLPHGRVAIVPRLFNFCNNDVGQAFSDVASAEIEVEIKGDAFWLMAVDQRDSGKRAPQLGSQLGKSSGDRFDKGLRRA